MTTTPPKPSDLPVRAMSAVVMIAVAGTALWLGGLVLDLFIGLIAVAGFCEFVTLVARASNRTGVRGCAIVAGGIYFGLAAFLLTKINTVALLLLIIGSVVMVDIGAYFFGRGIGGPKIAPSISPSKTWAGLLGGILGATLAIFVYFAIGSGEIFARRYFEMIPFGALIAVLAQSGDFFESWLKRKAGVKDSSNLIPGHGGVLDRIDGMLPVVILTGLVLVYQYPHWLNR